MATDKRDGWLKDLKVGDAVACGGWGMGRSDVYVGKVASLTPTGMIRVLFDGHSTPDEFKPDGRKRNDGSWDHHTLQPYTDDLKADLLHKAKVQAAARYIDRSVIDVAKLDTLTNAALDELVRILRPFRYDKE